MSETTKKTHTPGPWSAGPSGAAVYGPDNVRLAALDARKETLGQRRPNAMLMAAAPGLLEFVERWENEISGGGVLDKLQGWQKEFCAEALALLKQAKGA